MGMVRAFSLLAVVLMVTGCATLSREQCQRGDWYSIGMADGQAGEPVSRLDRHVRACSQYGIAVNDQQYRQGRTQGLVDYCQLDNAFDTGLRGVRYQGVCPPAIDALFDRYNWAAYNVYQIRKEINEVEDQIRYRENRLYDRSLSDDDRRQLRYTLRDLDIRRDRLRYERYRAERYLDRLMDDARFRRSP